MPAPEARVELPADFDDGAAEALRGRLCEMLGAGAATIRLDFSRVRNVSALALSILASLTRDARQLDPAPALKAQGCSGALGVLLRVTGLDGMFTEDPPREA
jgi:anti-anti-sigma regulatory factor